VRKKLADNKVSNEMGKKQYIRYVGNGADNNTYEKIFKKHKISEYSIETGIGRNRQTVIQCLPECKRKQKAYNGFINHNGSFAGFHARKRTEDGWYWLTTDGDWEKYISNSHKYVVKHREKIGGLFDENTEEIVFQAVWLTGKDGDFVDCGYDFFSNPVMAHALGSLEGQVHGNTLEAFNYAMSCGYKVYETDVHMTGDDKLVLYHGWFASDEVRNMSYDELIKKKSGKNTMMNTAQLYKIMKEHPDFRVEIDLYNYKGDIIKKRIAALVEDFQHDDEVLDKLLIQAHGVEMLLDIDSVYKFKNYQLLAGNVPEKYDEVIDKCIDYGVSSVAMRTNLAKKKFVKKFRTSGIYILGFTVDHDVALAKRLLETGVNTLCTNYITPEILRSAKDTFGYNSFKIFYNSGKSDVQETYTEGIESGKFKGTLRITPSGNIEFCHSRNWKNDGKQQLVKNRFTREGMKFEGWHARITVDGRKLWYCTDGCYHLKGDIKKGRPYKKVLFKDGQIIPKWIVPEKAKYIMVAVWTKIGEENI
jgi:glycerophosphoryl diester phosphodiesterase